jgi:hypothetical protein
LSFSIAAFALKLGQRLPVLYHHGGRLTASTTLPYDFCRQFYDWLGSRCHRLISLSSELGFAKRNRSPSFSHRKTIILGVRFCRPFLHVYMRILSFLPVIASIGQSTRLSASNRRSETGKARELTLSRQSFDHSQHRPKCWPVATWQEPVLSSPSIMPGDAVDF